MRNIENEIKEAFYAIHREERSLSSVAVITKGFAAFAEWCHTAQVKAGWWTDLATGERKKRNLGQLIALMHSEISEGLEADRKNLADDKLPHRRGLEVELGDFLIRAGDFIGGIEETVRFGEYVGTIVRDGDHVPSYFTSENYDQFSDMHRHLSLAFFAVAQNDHGLAVYRIALAVVVAIHFAKDRGFDLHGAIVEKAAFNAKRPDHKLTNRKLEGGKAY